MYYDLFIFAIPILDMEFIIRSYFYRIHVIRRKQAQSVRRGLKYITVLSGLSSTTLRAFCAVVYYSR